MEDHKAIVRRFLTALGKGDVDTLKTLITDDVAAVCTGTSIVSGTRNYADICTTAGFLNKVTRNGIEFRILTMTAEEDRVSCEVEGRSTLANGKSYNNQYHFLFFLRNGKVRILKEYIDTKLADETLGPLLQAAQP